MDWILIYVLVVISPVTTINPIPAITSQATLAYGSFFKILSKTESAIWSQTLSGWPSVTDSEVKKIRVDINAFLCYYLRFLKGETNADEENHVCDNIHPSRRRNRRRLRPSGAGGRISDHHRYASLR